MLIRYFACACIFLLLAMGSTTSIAQQEIGKANNPMSWRARYVVQAVISPWRSTTVVATHRGAHSLYNRQPNPFYGTPENSLEAILKAAQDGAELIEIDIRQTSDGVPILSHDSTWGRETNLGCNEGNQYNPNTNTGRNDAVNSLPLSFVQRLVPGNPANCGRQGILLKDSISGRISTRQEYPPTLQDVITFVRTNGIGAALALDIKDANALKASIDVVLSNKDSYGYNFADDVIFKVPSTAVSPADIKNTYNTHKISWFYEDWQYLHIMPVYQTSHIQEYAYGADKPGRPADPEFWVRQNIASWASSEYRDMFAGAEVDLKETGGILSSAIREANSAGFSVSNFQPVPETATGYYRDGSCAPCAQLSEFFFKGTNGLPSDRDDRRADTAFQLTSAQNAMITTDDYLGMTASLQRAGRRQNMACLTDYGHERCENFFSVCNRAGNTIPCGSPVSPTTCTPGVCVVEPPAPCDDSHTQCQGPDPNPCDLNVQCFESDLHSPRGNILLGALAPVPAQRVGYFNSWSVYGNGFFVKNLDTQGIASRLTTLMYAFENIDPVNLTCFAANQGAAPDTTSPTAYDGASDAYADYQMNFTAANSVDGSTDQWGQKLAGNFNQLKKLKAKHPHLKVLVSLGGWTYSKYFSDVARSDASRKKFVRSCIDLYIKGNLPILSTSPAGGTGAAAGVFDGIDIDWEYPGSADGNVGNHYSAQDTANFTALLAEFRAQLDALGGKHYMLTAAVPAGPGDINNIQVAQIAPYLDFANIMTYDFHGAWETNGPTNFQTPLFDSPSSPAFATGFTVNSAVSTWINRGFPASKLNLGVAFYARGWTGVKEGGTRGLYQLASGATAPFPFSQQAGVAFYKELKAAGLLNSKNLYFDTITDSSYLYDGNNFYGIEVPHSLRYKREYIKQKGLGGIMIYSLEDDDSESTLFKAATGP